MMLVNPDEVLTGALVDVIAVVGRRFSKAAAGLRKADEDLATARWFETFRLTGTVPDLPGLSEESWDRLVEALGGSEVQAALQELLVARLTDAPETQASQARDAVRATLSTVGPDAAASAEALSGYYDDQICALVARLEAEQPPLLSQIRREAFSHRIISSLRAIERHTAALSEDERHTDIYRVLEQAPANLARDLRVLDFERLVAERTRTFVGREFCFQAIDRAIADPDFPSGYILVRGEPGIGKTAMLSELVRTRGYVHHFNIAAEGIRSTRAFLANLCAQLIVRYRLEHTELPPEALTDSAFLSRLLAEAAAISGPRPVVVVVDALDEAESEDISSAANQLHLPSTLPDGVFFVLTSREQLDYRLVVSRRTDLYLQDDDPHNLADIRSYVRNQLQEHPETRARVGALDVTADEFVEVITDRSQGNFMYLVHVLDDIRLGHISLETVGNVHNLPQGLRAYYEQHWRTMRAHDRDRFERFYEPVLRTLATVREPAELSAIEEWSKVEPARIREVLRAWRPFLNESPAEDGTARYRVYHTSFQDFLAEEGVGLQPYHERIALAASQRKGQVPSAYERRNLVAHLAKAGCFAELHDLLSREAPDGSNRWWRVRSEAGETAGYLADLDLARQYSHAPKLQLRYALMSASVRATTAHVSPTMLRALLETGIWSVPMAYHHAREITDRWSRVEALLAVISYDTGPARREAIQAAVDTARTGLVALPELLPLLEPAARRQLVVELLARPWLRDHRGALLRAVAPVIRDHPQLLPAAESVAYIEFDGTQDTDRDSGLLLGLNHQQEAELLAGRIATRQAEFQLDRVRCLLALAEAVPGRQADLVTEALTVAESTDMDFYLRSALDELGPYLKGRSELIDRAITCARSLRSPAERGLALAALVPLLPPGLALQATGVALGIARQLQDSGGTERFTSVKIIARIAPTLSSAQRTTLVGSALATVRLIRDDNLNHHLAVIELAPHLAGDRQLLTRALDLLSPISPLDGWCAAALRELAGHLAMDPGLVHRAIDIAASIPDPAYRADALAATTSTLSAERRSELLRAVLADLSRIDDTLPCSRALAALAAAAASPDRIPRILRAADSLPASARATVLIALAHHLPESHSAPIVETILTLARSDDTLFGYAYTLADLATPALLPQLEQPLLQALRAAEPGYNLSFAFFDAVMAVLPHITQCSSGAVTAAVGFLSSLPDRDEHGEHTRAWVLAGAVRHLAGTLRRQAASEVLSVLSSAPDLREQGMLRGPDRLTLLTSIGPHLAEEPDLAQKTLVLATTLTGQRQRAVAILNVLPSLHTAPELLQLALASLLDLPTTLPGGEQLRTWAVLSALPALARYPKLQARARKVLATDQISALKLQVLLQTGEVPDDLLKRVISAPDPGTRVWLLAQLRPLLSPQQRQTAEDAVLTALPTLADSDHAAAAAYTGGSVDLTNYLLHECDKITHIGRRPRLFLKILDDCDLAASADLAFEVALNTTDPDARRRMLTAITAHVPETRGHTWWRALINALAKASRPDRLGDLEAGAALAVVMGGPDLALSLAEETVKIRRWWS